MTPPNFSAVALIASPKPNGTTRTLAEFAAARLAALDVRIRLIDLATLPSEGLLGRVSSDRIDDAIAAVRRADIVLVATSIEWASYSGLLKVFLDLLPPDALGSKVAVPLTTGGSNAHLLAVDFALRPMLVSLGAAVTSRAVYAESAELATGRIAPALAERLERAADESLLLAASVRAPALESASLQLASA